MNGLTSPQRRHYLRQQSGYTIIEIMVALVISLILLMGVIEIFMSSRTSYALQSGVARLQENGRYALDIMSRNIGMAGYNAPQGIVSANTLDNESENTGLGFTQALGTASDVIEITYESTTDCLGNASGGTATDRYYVDGTTLMCLGNGNVNAGPLADGIENMQILYGEDTDADKVANQYVSADNVTAWTNIVSVRIALLVSTVDDINILNTNVYRLLNAPQLGPINDELVRRVYARTILLRNFTP
jgi:type IV pilus assembly protein PilW